VGAVTTETEDEVTSGLRTALAARRRIEQGAMLGHPRFGGHRMHRRAAGHPAPSGPLRALPVGVLANGEIDGVAIRFYLGALVIDQSSAMLTVQARFPAELVRHDDRPMDPIVDAFNEGSAIDDRGSKYAANFGGGGGSNGEWACQLHVRPTPPAGVRWLDVTLLGAAAVRLRLDAPSGDQQVTTEPVVTSAADRFIDAQSVELLSHGRTRFGWAADEAEPALFWLASHLLAAGVLTVESRSLRRLATVAERLGEHLTGQLSLTQPEALPADWLSLEAAAKREDGPAGMIPVAAVLPEIDGAQCVITELASEADGATLHVRCAGWPEPRRHGIIRIDQFWWSARDDLGGSYACREGSWSYSNGHADLDLRLFPAIDPRARVLDIILAGPTTQVTVSVPLDWQEAL